MSPPTRDGDQGPGRGWYPDPTQSGRFRYWDGSRWTSYVVARASTADPDHLRRELATFADYLRTEGFDDPRLANSIEGYVARRCGWGPVGQAPITPVAPAPMPAQRLPRAELPSLASCPPRAGPPMQPVRESVPTAAPTTVPPHPKRAAEGARTRPAVEPLPAPARLPAPTAPRPTGPSMWDRVRQAIVSDLTVHGLAYLGVLLVFAGVLGLLVFSWGDVGSGLQPVAEVAVPVALIGAGAVLTRRGSVVVGRALVLVGAAIVPLVMIAAVADGSPVPPDAHYSALVAWAAGAFFAVAAVYAALTLRRPESTLRYLVAPAVWLGVGMVALAPRADEVIGETVAEPSSVQVAAVLVAVSATVWLARLWPTHRLSRPTLVVAIPGLAVFAVLAVVIGAQTPWPLAASVAAAVAIVVGLEAVAPLLPDPVIGVGQVLGAGAGVAVVGTSVAPAWTSVIGVVVFLALLEWEGVRRPNAAGLLSAGAAVGVALAVSLIEPWASVAAFAAATGWSWAALFTTREWLPRRAAEVAAAVLPFGIVIGLFRAIDPGPATTTVAAVVAVVALATRRARVDDPLVRSWLQAAAAAALVLPVALSADAAAGWLAAAAACAVVAVAAAPYPTPLRIWLVAAGLVEVGAFVSIVAGTRPEWTAIVLAAAGAIAVVAARPALPHGGHVGVLGHLATVAAAPIAAVSLGEPRGWPVSICVGLVVAGLLVTSWYQEHGRAPVIELLVEGLARTALDGDAARPAVPALAVAGLPVALLSAADSAGLVDGHRGRAGVILATIGALYAGLTWAARDRRRISVPMQAVGLVCASLGVALALPAAAAATAAAALLAVTCLAPHPSVRWAALAWIGWAATALAVVRAADAAGLTVDRWCLAVLGWAAIVAVGALAADRVIAGARTEPGWVRVTALAAPATLGGAAIPAGLIPTYLLDATTWAWSSVGTAAVILVIAVLTRAGAVSGLSWLLLAVGAGGLAPFDPLDEPPVFVATAAVMAVASLVLARVAPRRGIASWELPPLVVGTVIALVGIVIAVPDAVVATWSAAGGLAIAVAAARREPAWVIAGVVLLDGAALAAGRGWLALALVLTAVVATAAAVLAQGPARVVLRLVGVVAAIGSFEVLLLDVGWMSTRAELSAAGVTAAALVGGGVWCALGLGARLVQIGRGWVVPWAAGAALVLAQAGVGLAEVDRQPAGTAFAVGLALAAVGSALAAAPLRVDALRELAVVLAAGACGVRWWAVDASAASVTASLCVITVVAVGVSLLPRVGAAAAWRRPLALAIGLAAVGAPVVAAAGRAGAGWVALGLAVLSVAATRGAAALPVADPDRVVLQGAGALAAVASFEAILVREGWIVAEPHVVASTAAVVAAALAGGALVTALGGAARWAQLGRDWVVVWGVGGAALVVQSAVMLADAERLRGGLALAAALTLSSLGLALAARPFAAGGLRDAAAGLLLGAVLVALWAGDASAGVVVGTTSALALGAAAGSLVLGPSRPGSPWRRPLDALAAAGVLAALGVALAALPDRDPLVVALLTSSALCATFGVARRLVALQLAVPPLLCAAWLVVAVDVVRGEALWFTVPVGVALLAVAAIGRRRHQHLGGTGTPMPFVGIEVAGYCTLLLPPLIEVVTDTPSSALVSIAVGLVLAAWGILTKVRRRLAAGVVGVVVSVVVLVVVPLASRVSTVRATGPTVWLIVLGLGVVAIALATVLERGRATVGRSVQRIGELTRGWE